MANVVLSRNRRRTCVGKMTLLAPLGVGHRDGDENRVGLSRAFCARIIGLCTDGELAFSHSGVLLTAYRARRALVQPRRACRRWRETTGGRRAGQAATVSTNEREI